MAVGVNQGHPQGVVEIWDLSTGQKVKILPVFADLNSFSAQTEAGWLWIRQLAWNYGT